MSALKVKDHLFQGPPHCIFFFWSQERDFERDRVIYFRRLHVDTIYH